MKELENFGGTECSRASKVVWWEMAPKMLEQAQLKKQKPHVDSSLKQVADIEGESGPKF